MSFSFGSLCNKENVLAAILHSKCFRLIWWGIICLGLIISEPLLLTVKCSAGMTPEGALMNAVKKKSTPKSQVKPGGVVPKTTKASKAASAQNRAVSKPHRTAGVKRRTSYTRNRTRTVRRRKPRVVRTVRKTSQEPAVAATIWPR